MSKEIITTRESLKAFRYHPTNAWLALAEFIDNSIASFRDNDNNYPIIGLKIDVIYDDTNPKCTKLIIVDNARGMNASKLEEAMQPHDRTGKSSQQLNQYGIGMKLGVFWYGENFTIYSKSKNDNEYKLVLNTDEKENQKEKLIVTAETSYDNHIKTDSGTMLVISKIYSDRDPFTKRDLANKIEDALRWRYAKLLEEGLIINFSLKSQRETKNKNVRLLPLKINYFKRQQLFDSKRNNNPVVICQKIDEYNKVITKLHEDLESGEIKKTEQEISDLDLLKEAYDKFNNNQELKFKKTIKINNKETELEFGVIDYNLNSKNKYSGVTIYHSDRAIIHGPNEGRFGAFQFVESSHGTMGKYNLYRHLIGHLDLTGIQDPDYNKTDFNWSIEAKEELRTILLKIINTLNPLLKIINAIDNIKENTGLSKKDAPIVINQSKLKFPTLFKNIDISTNEFNELGLKGNANLFNKEYTIEIYETNHNVDFINIEHDGYKCVLKIFLEAEHKFWKPLISDAGFKGEFLYPIAVFFGVTQLIYNEDFILDEIDPNRIMSYSQIISKLIKDW